MEPVSMYHRGIVAGTHLLSAYPWLVCCAMTFPVVELYSTTWKELPGL